VSASPSAQLIPTADLRDDTADPVYAGWLRRVAASLIDTAVLVGGFFGGMMAIGIWESATGSSDGTLIPLVVSAFFAAVVFYEPVCHGAWKQTVGKRAMGIALATTRGDSATFGRALWRHLAKLGLAVIPFGALLDALNPLASKKNQTVHDAVARTIVVRVR
jgi:uncharacterized RDD family membrane protein YckC